MDAPKKHTASELEDFVRIARLATSDELYVRPHNVSPAQVRYEVTRKADGAVLLSTNTDRNPKAMQDARLAAVARTAVIALGDRIQELTSLLAAERRAKR